MPHPAVRPFGLIFGVALAWGGVARAQSAGATVTGTVRERLNDVGLPLATVALDGTDRVVFTRGGGAFVIAGVSPGAHTFRVRQIGFAPTTLRVTVPDSGTVDAGIARLERLAVALATIEVRAQPSECVGTGLRDPGADSMATVLLARLSDQSDRQRAFAATYPGLLRFENVRETLDADSAVLETKTDTGVRYMVDTLPYHVGFVGRKVSLSHFVIRVPSAAQLSSAEFVAHHCASYAGTRTIGGVAFDVLEIAPTRGVHTPDIAGLVLLTPQGLLRRTELRVTRASDMNFGAAGGGNESFVMASDFRPILGGRVSLLSSVVLVQATRTPYVVGHKLLRVRDCNRTLAYRFTGERPPGDSASVTPLAAPPAAPPAALPAAPPAPR